MKIKALMLGAAFAAALGGAASAQDGRTTSRADRDGDQRISLAEMQGVAAARFAALDADRDGRLTRDERRAGRQSLRAERTARRAERMNAAFVRGDANRDGVLAQAEAPRRLQARFGRFDADRDGALTPAELQAGRRAMQSDARASRQAARQAARTNRPAEARGDGVVTLAEMQARVSARFARLDANRDGFVTRDERRTGRAARQG